MFYGISASRRIVSYDTNIYTLYNGMFADGDPASIDLLQHLKEREQDPEKKELFDERYTDILLIFDLDPQDSQFSADKILEMPNYFVESSDMGKLYLNYPMVEAFYHMKSIPDENYNSYTATLEELRSGTYKRRVNRENRNHDYRKFAVTKEECNVVIQQNIEKAWFLVEPTHTIDSVTLHLPESVDVLKAQLRNIEDYETVAVLSTCAFYIVDYNPALLQ